MSSMQGTINNCPYCGDHMPPDGLPHLCHKQPKTSPTAFMEKEGISITDMIDWLEAELSGIEHARIGGVSISREGVENEAMMLAITDLLESLL